MSILLGNYDFDGPFVAQTEILDRAGIVAVLVQTNDSGEEDYELVDLVETSSCRLSASRAFVDFNVDGALSLAVFYTESDSHAERCKLRTEIIAEFEHEDDPGDENLELGEEKICVGAI